MDCIGHLLALANCVIRIDDEGQVTELRTTPVSRNETEPEDEYTNRSDTSIVSLTAAVSVSQGHIAAPEMTQDKQTGQKAQDTDTDRASGDLATYVYYFKSAGLVSTAIFMILQLIFGFLQAFPSKSKNLSDNQIRSMLLIILIYSIMQTYGSSGGLRPLAQILELTTICTWASMSDCRSFPWPLYVF